MSSTLDFALAYAARGWRVVPIGPGTKYPCLDAWQERATTDVDTIVGHWTAHPDHGVGIATGEGSGVFVLDVDVAAGKEGDETLRQLEAEHGELPATVEAITGTGGRHLFYRHPPGLDLSNSAGRLGSGLDIRANGGQVVAAPTLHPDTGRPYAFDLEHHPDDVPVAEAPAWLLKLLEPPPKVDAGPRGDYGDAQLAWDRFNYNPDVTAFVALMLAEAGWTEGRPDRNGARYFTRPGKTHGISASLDKVAPGVLFCFTSSAPPLEAERTYDPADVLALLKFDGDRAKADAELVRQGWGLPSHSITDDDVAGWIAEGRSVEQVAVVEERASRWLPPSFWRARPYLAHIHQAARAQMIPPDALLGAVLARVAVMVPHNVELPAIVGNPVGLTFYAAFVGPPAAGKSTAAGLAARLLPATPQLADKRHLKTLPIGSGEGFVDVMFEMVTEEGDDGKKRTTKQQTKFGALFHIDEGSILGDLKARSGSTLMPTLRTAFTHGTLGNVNASLERRRILDGHAYVYGVTMGIQPDAAGPLLDEVAEGTPQRFVWLMATDPELPDEDVPEPSPLELTWTPPAGLTHEANVDGFGRSVLGVPAAVKAEVRAARRAATRGDGDHTDGHRMLVRLKVAALLGLLDGRPGIDLEDWRLAGVVVECSRLVRSSIEQHLTHVDAQAEDGATARLERREARLEDAAARRALASASKSVARIVGRHLERGAHGDRPCSRNCLVKAIASKHRELVAADDVIAEAMRLEWLEAAGEGFGPGRSVPL